MNLYLCGLLLSCTVGLTYQATLPANTVEVYFVVDQRVVNKFVAEQTSGDAASKRAKAIEVIGKDIDYIVTEMNVLYESLLEKGISIKVAKSKVDFLEFTLFTENQEVDPGLKAFDSWLKQENSFATIKYDAAIYFTGSELTSNEDKGVAGYAHVGEVCTETASGIVEFDGTFHQVITTAHELGHILGASHDSLATGFVMIPTSKADEPNRWDFSLCTAEAFNAVIGKLSTNCLLETASQSTVPEASVTEGMGNPETICRRSVGSAQSYMCTGENLYDGPASGDNICKRIWCKDPANNYCTSAFASDGMICAQNKRCNEGTCIDSPDAESGAVDASCMYGDQAELSYNTNKGPYKGDCKGFVDFMGGASICKDDSVRSSCCKTCGDLSTGIAGCEYGDTYPSCNEYTQDQICGAYSDICCQFCHGWRKKRSAGNGSDAVLPDVATATPKVKDNLKPKPDEVTPKDGASPPVHHNEV